jgi:hypothetical protein
MDDTVWGGGIARKSRDMCSLARVSTALGVKHLIADLSRYLTVVEMHTKASDWKRVIIIIVFIM